MAIQLPLKEAACRPVESRKAQPRVPRRVVFLIVAVVSLSFFHFGAPPLPIPNLVRDEPYPSIAEPFEYESITPSESLVYHDCFDGYQCARLSVPLDWNSTAEDGGPRAALAIIKKPAAVPVTDPRYGGVILLNPGGPGGSGVAFVLNYGDAISTIVNAATDPDSLDNAAIQASADKYFDILSWDPRAVNHTTPAVQCFSDSFHRETFTSQLEAIGFDLSDRAVLNGVWSRTRALSAACSRSSSQDANANLSVDGEHIAQFVSTANVVRDMVEIVERHGEWREHEAMRIEATARLVHRPGTEVVPRAQRTAKIDHLVWRRGEEKLQYWGFSYGTLLGQTFASMQPHRVQRVVLDGVVDAADYTRVGWSTNLNDIDAITRNFTQQCHAAGPARCALHDPAGPSAIAANIDTLLAALRAEPLGVLLAVGPAVVTADSVLQTIFHNWYSPSAQFGPTAALLASLMAGNASAYAAQQSPHYRPFCDGAGADPGRMAAEARDSATLAIACADGDDVTATSRAQYGAHVAKLHAQSAMFGDLWARIPLMCTAFGVRPKWRFAGPYGAATAHPMLFASQTLDPVTPLRNARGAAKLFPGAGVLNVDGLGHCTLAMPSVCGAKVIRRYFQTGEVEAQGVKCPVDRGAFEPESEVGMGGSDGVLARSVERVARAWEVRF